MGQNEIFAWLAARRRAGDHRFFSRKEIEKEVGGGYRIYGQLDALYLFKYLEVRMAGFSSRRYRLRARYVPGGVPGMTHKALRGSAEGAYTACKHIPDSPSYGHGGLLNE